MKAIFIRSRTAFDFEFVEDDSDLSGLRFEMNYTTRAWEEWKARNVRFAFDLQSANAIVACAFILDHGFCRTHPSDRYICFAKRIIFVRDVDGVREENFDRNTLICVADYYGGIYRQIARKLFALNVI